jgi:hypothetical protein
MHKTVNNPGLPPFAGVPLGFWFGKVVLEPPDIRKR